jgi:hypothetical protein
VRVRLGPAPDPVVKTGPTFGAPRGGGDRRTRRDPGLVCQFDEYARLRGLSFSGGQPKESHSNEFFFNRHQFWEDSKDLSDCKRSEGIF